jgi:hypothetical protein
MTGSLVRTHPTVDAGNSVTRRVLSETPELMSSSSGFRRRDRRMQSGLF